jgi:hypothetical protein
LARLYLVDKCRNLQTLCRNSQGNWRNCPVSTGSALCGQAPGIQPVVHSSQAPRPADGSAIILPGTTIRFRGSPGQWIFAVPPRRGTAAVFIDFYVPRFRQPQHNGPLHDRPLTIVRYCA